MSMRLLTQRNDPPVGGAGEKLPQLSISFPTKRSSREIEETRVPPVPFGIRNFPPTGGTFP